MTTRRDYEVLSSGGMIRPLSCVLLLLGLAPFAKDPPPADRFTSLAMFLDNPAPVQIPLVVVEAPGEGAIPPRSDLPATGEAFWETGSSNGAPATALFGPEHQHFERRVLFPHSQDDDMPR